MDSVSIVALLAALVLGFANGSNDVSKAIATLAGAGVTTYRRALIWGAAWTAIGSLLSLWLAKALLKTFISGWFTKGTHVPAIFAIAVGVGALTWVLFATRTGLPVSTTHSLTGAIVGLGAVTLGMGAVAWSALVGKIVVPLLVSPFVGLALSFLIVPLLARLVDPKRELTLCVAVKQPQPAMSLQGAGAPRAPGALAYQAVGAQASVATATAVQGPGAGTSELCVYVPTFVKLNANRLHWLSSAGIALARALNDTPKIVAIAAIAMLAEGVNLAGFKNLIFVGMAVAMTVGSLAGIVVARKMGEKVTRLTEVDGFIANLVTAVLVGGAANMGLPVSTTHVSNGSIVGVGLRRGAGGVSWKTIRDFVLAWIITLPAGAVLALVAYYVIHLFLR